MQMDNEFPKNFKFSNEIPLEMFSILNAHINGKLKSYFTFIKWCQEIPIGSSTVRSYQMLAARCYRYCVCICTVAIKWHLEFCKNLIGLNTEHNRICINRNAPRMSRLAIGLRAIEEEEEEVIQFLNTFQLQLSFGLLSQNT